MARMKTVCMWGLMLLKWLFIDAWPVWIGIIVFVGSLTLYVMTSPTEFIVRCIGVIMQFFGFLLAMIALLSKLKEFNVQPVRE